MHRYLIGLLVMGSFSFSFFARASDISTAKVSEKIEETTESVQAKLEGSLAELNDRIEVLEKDVDSTTGAMKADLKKKIADLRAEKEQVKDKLKNLKGKSGKAWSELRTGAFEALQKLEEAYKKAKDEFKKESTSN